MVLSVIAGPVSEPVVFNALVSCQAAALDFGDGSQVVFDLEPRER